MSIREIIQEIVGTLPLVLARLVAEWAREDDLTQLHKLLSIETKHTFQPTDSSWIATLEYVIPGPHDHIVTSSASSMARISVYDNQTDWIDSDFLESLVVPLQRLIVNDNPRFEDFSTLVMFKFRLYLDEIIQGIIGTTASRFR